MSQNAVTTREEGKKEVAPVATMTRYVTSLSETLADCLPRSVPVERFVRAAHTAILKDHTGKLASCTRQSVLHSLMECARVGLMPDGRQAALIGYYNKELRSNEAKFTPMVEGIIDLFHRAPGVSKVEARAVRGPVEGDPDDIEADVFEYEYGIDSMLRHVPRCPPSGSEFDPRVQAAYAIVWWSNGAPPTFEVIGRGEVERARKMGQGQTPMWNQWYGEGARKVAVKRLSKYVDLEPEAAAVIARDHELETGERARAPRTNGTSVEAANLNAALTGHDEGTAPAGGDGEHPHEDTDPAASSGEGQWHLGGCPEGYGLWAETIPHGGWYFPARCRGPKEDPAPEDYLVAEGDDAPRKVQKAEAFEMIRLEMIRDQGGLGV